MFGVESSRIYYSGLPTMIIGAWSTMPDYELLS
jgi:hypothetical protein